MPSASTDVAPLWREILSEGAGGSDGTHTPKTMLVLGDDGVGKESLITQLRPGQKAEAATRTALEFSYIDNFGPEEDMGENAPKLNVWKLNGLEHQDLIKYALKANGLGSTVVMLVLDFEKPWLFLDTITKWMVVLKKQIGAVLDEDKGTGIDIATQQAQVQWFQNYVEPAKEDGSGKPSFTDSSALAGDDDIVLPLGDGTLTENLGVPIIIACNKSDVMPTLEKNFEYQDSDFEFIQQNLRTEALKYGATLLYTSTKNGKGIEILRDYLAHRLLGSPFTTRAQVLDKDTLFVPSGYDTLDRITVLNDHTKTGSYEEIIAAPTKKKVAVRKEEEIKAQDDQAFLETHKGNLEKAGKGERPVRTPMASVELSTDNASESPGPATGTPTQPTAATGAGTPASSLTPGSSAMLQSFFESLMKSESNEGLRKGVEDVIAEEKKKGT